MTAAGGGLSARISHTHCAVRMQEPPSGATRSHRCAAIHLEPDKAFPGMHSPGALVCLGWGFRNQAFSDATLVFFEDRAEHDECSRDAKRARGDSATDAGDGACGL